MPLRSSGLQTHIWNNNFKSLVFLAIYPFIILLILWACVFFFYSMTGSPTQSLGNSTEERLLAGIMGMEKIKLTPAQHAGNFIYDYWPTIFAVIIGWFVVSYFFHGRMISSMSHSHPVTRKEEPELYNMLENLCIAEGMKMPKFNIIESHALNAFASGINDKTYTVTLTRGLLNRLAKDEVEGVIAHELTHIQNKDVRLLMITIVFTGMVGLAAQLAWSNLRYGVLLSSGDNRKGGGILLVIGIAAILGIGYMATIFMRFALSRTREYMADAGAVRMTKNPEAMMRALMRISGKDNIPEAPTDIAFMCIENSKPFMGLFATHPPINKRLLAIGVATDTSVPDHLPPVSPEKLETNRTNPWLPRERPFRQKSKT